MKGTFQEGDSTRGHAPLLCCALVLSAGDGRQMFQENNLGYTHLRIIIILTLLPSGTEY